jgi:uncharacterized protein
LKWTAAAPTWLIWNEEITTKPYRVLSLDGGGIRGLYTAVLLRGLTAQFAQQQGLPDTEEYDLGRQFDLIVGTSTGAILATALAAGVPLSKVVALYLEKGREIFQDPVPNKKRDVLVWSARNSLGAANDPAALQAALDDVFKIETLGELYTRRGIGLCIPSVDAETLKAWVFKTPHLPRLQRDTHRRLSDVCMASAAAPLIFPLKRIPRPGKAAAASAERTNWFIDGGLWANNPSLVALTEALTTAAEDRQIILVSASTCPPFKGATIGDNAGNRGLLAWKAGVKMTETALDAQSFAYDYVTRTLAGCARHPVEYVRLSDPEIGAEDVPHLGMDNPSPECLERLVSLAHRAVDRNRSEATTGAPAPKAVLNTVFADLRPFAATPAPAQGQEKK